MSISAQTGELLVRSHPTGACMKVPIRNSDGITLESPHVNHWSATKHTYRGQPRTLIHREIAIVILLIRRCSRVRNLRLVPVSAKFTGRRISTLTLIRQDAQGRSQIRGRRRARVAARTGPGTWLTSPGRASAASGAGSGTSVHCGPACCPQAAAHGGTEATSESRPHADTFEQQHVSFVHMLHLNGLRACAAADL